MINLPEVARKIENILNGTDLETSGFGHLGDYQFIVATEGFHLDSIYDKQTHKNVIYVFIGSMGGEYQPIPSLKEADYNIPIAIYYPVRFKNDFFQLNEYLVDYFVGRYLNYGALSGKCLSNISVAQYGEIEELDLEQFKLFINSTYTKPIETMEAYMSMQFTLYLSTIGSDFKYGNEASLSITYGTYTDSTPIFDDTNIQSASDVAGEQLLGGLEGQGIPTTTSYSTGFKLYYKSTKMYKAILKDWFDGKAQEQRFSLNITFDDQTFTRSCYLTNVIGLFKKGEPVVLTFTFGKSV